MTNEWTKPEHAEAYLARMKDIPHRVEGEATLLSEIPPQSQRVLDLGCGNGHLLSLILTHCPNAIGVGLDFSPTMLDQASDRFSSDDRVTLIEHNMDESLPDLGGFDCVVSSFAIHHCTHARKRELYAEVFTLLEPQGPGENRTGETPDTGVELAHLIVVALARDGDPVLSSGKLV